MVVRVINEMERLPEPSWRARFGTRAGILTGKNVILFGLTVFAAGLVLYVVLESYSSARSVPGLVNTAVEPALQKMDDRVDETLARIDQNVRTSLQTLGDEVGGLPETDRAVTGPQTRPWVLHTEGLQTIDSRDPEMNKATEIHVAAGLSDDQVKTLATEVDTRVDSKLTALVAKVDSHLDQKLQEIASRNELTNSQLASLKTELTESVNVVLHEEMARNQELSRDNAIYRVLFHRSLDLNQDLIALYAGQAKDDHAIGNVLKVVPKLFTLQVWQNRDKQDEYLRLLSRYGEITTDGQRVDGANNKL